jgi:hypothetical protein
MIKKESHEQFNLFGTSTEPIVPKIQKKSLSVEERAKRMEKEDAHRAWKLLKSRQCDHLLTSKDKYLLQKHYGVKL